MTSDHVEVPHIDMDIVDDGTTRTFTFYEVDMHNIASPDTSDPGIEREIQAKGLTAPRITPADIEANIARYFYFTAGQAADWLGRTTDADAPEHLLTFCVLVLRNGFTVTGESACASPENFDADIGRKIARANAVQKIWPLMGYELRSKLAEGVAA